MATSSAMKSSLMLVLLLSAVAVSHAHEVTCKNSCKDPIWLNDILVPAGKSVTLKLAVDLKIVLKLFDLEGKKHTATYKCPKDVKKLEFLYNKVTLVVYVKITGVLSLVGGILKSVLGSLIGLLKCNLH